MSTSTWGRFLLGLTAALAAVALATGCGDDDSPESAGGSATAAATADQPKKKITVFYYAPRGFNDVTRRFHEGWDQAKEQLAGQADVQIKSMSRLEIEPAPFLDHIKAGLVQQPDGIVVSSLNGKGMKAGLEQLAAQGQKIMLHNENVPGMKGAVAFIGSDNVAEGKLAAQYVVEQQKAGKLKSDKVAVIAFPPGTDVTDKRTDAFVEGLEGTPLKVVAKRVGDCGAPKARSLMADVLSANPDLGAAFSVCDGSAVGAAQAFKAAGRLDVAHVSIDALTPALELIKSGQGVSADISAQLEQMSIDSVVWLNDALRGKKVPPHTEMEPTLITKDNVDEYLTKK